jgi:hypothetical protein
MPYLDAETAVRHSFTVATPIVVARRRMINFSDRVRWAGNCTTGPTAAWLQCGCIIFRDCRQDQIDDS